MPAVSDHVLRFRRLHESGCFVIPNPWDAGSAKALAQLGFPALATTSSGFAWTLGRRDTHVPLDDVLAHVRAIAAAVDVPVSADFEAGFAVRPEEVAANVLLLTGTGAAGLSIEDSTGDDSNPLFEFDLAVERVRAAHGAIARSGTGLVLTARSEGFVAGRPDLDETIRRLVAYAGAGADCLYAPGVRDLGDIRAIIAAVAPKPVNVLCVTSLTVRELEDAGVRRISVGSGLARAGWTAALAAAREIARDGTFAAIAAAVPGAEINGLFDAS